MYKEQLTAEEMPETPSIKRNFILNLINTVSGLLFPLITFPYASRILLADGIGQVQFFTSIIDYVTLLTSLGIPLYAIREIARVRDDQKLLSKTTIEIILLHAVLSLIGYVIVFILACTVAKIQTDVPLFILLSFSILFVAIGANWFYSGIEDFKYITIRSIIVKIVSLIALFVFVKEKNDLFYYAAITVVGTVGSNLFNFFRLRKYIMIKSIHIHELDLRRHLKPSLKIFALNLVISLYVNLDAVMLGFLKDETAVGYYTASIKISKTLIGVVTSLGTVLLPRLSSLASREKMEEFRALSDKCIHFIIALSLPLAIGTLFMASPMIHLFSGQTFDPSILTLQLLAPIIFLIPLSGIYNMQILYALGREKLAIISVSAGAVINFSLNLFLIPLYSHHGAGFATLIAELAVALTAILLGRKYVPIHLFSKEKIPCYIASFLIILILSFMRFVNMNELTYLLLGTIVSVVAYITFLLLMKDKLLLEIKSILINLLNR